MGLVVFQIIVGLYSNFYTNTEKNTIFYHFLKGIRSDSDMFSYSFSWKLWKSTKIIASGEEIKNYLTRAVEEEGKFHAVVVLDFPVCLH